MSDPFRGFDPAMFANVPLFRELAKVMSWTGGPVNWSLAADTALSIAAPPGALPSVADRDTDEFAAAVAVAELWLDQVTTLPAVDGPARALSAAEWTRQAASSAGLGVYVEPVAAGMGGALSQQLPEGMQALGEQLSQAMTAMSAMLYGVQVGTIAGHLAGQLLSVYDLGLPTVDPRTVATVGSTATDFARDFNFDPVELRHWLALREVAHRRLFAGLPWLRPHVAELLARFAAEAELDPGALFEGLGGMGFDPTDPSALTEALSGPDAFRVEPSPAQQITLGRLQTLVAFVEGWSDTVVHAAAAGKLPSLERMEESLRRRRAEKGPGERFLEQLIGLDLKPADLRVGQAFCEAVLAARGQEGLERAWRRPEAVPTPAELAEPSRWLLRLAAEEIEADLAADPRPDDENPAS